VYTLIERFGAFIAAQIRKVGGFTEFSFATLHAVVFAIPTWARWSRLGPQLYFIGSRSVPVLALTGAFIGAILAIEGYDQFAEFGQEHRLGGVVNISIIKQIGPVLAAVMLAGRVGCSLTAELGSMRVTEQLDAMRVMAADPIRVLVAPRFVACVLMIPVLTVVSNVCGVAGGWLVTTHFYGVDQHQYWDFTAAFIDWFDIFNGMVKSFFFGAAIALIACSKGFTCGAGASGVGRATTEAFVTSFVAIVVINFLLAKLLNDIDSLRMAGSFL
jgi:phospholipid/cholesterol/gamma-HCH transport system permease protein